MASSGDEINRAIKAAVDKSGLGTREIARRVYGDAERDNDIARYMRPGAPRPKASTAVLLAAAVGAKPHAFLGASPLEAAARELAEATAQAETILLRLDELATASAAGFDATQRTLDTLNRRLAALEKRLPREAARSRRKTP